MSDKAKTFDNIRQYIVDEQAKVLGVDDYMIDIAKKLIKAYDENPLGDDWMRVLLNVSKRVKEVFDWFQSMKQ